MQNNSIAVTKADRLVAWRYRPDCYQGNETYTKWMKGLYDKIPLLQSFAAHRTAAIQQQATEIETLRAALLEAVEKLDHIKSGGEYICSCGIRKQCVHHNFDGAF